MSQYTNAQPDPRSIPLPEELADKLKVNRVFLVDEISMMGDVCDHLYADGVFTTDDIEEIKLNATRKDMVRRMLDQLTRASLYHYNCFKDALEKTLQKHIAERL